MRTFRTLFAYMSILTSMMLFANSAQAQVEAAEIYCTVRDAGTLNCQWVGKEARKSMSSDDVVQFIDKAEVAAYMTVKSRRGHERVFFVDPESPQFRKLSDIKKTGSISEISKAKNDLFGEIEKKTIKISDDLDAMNPAMELVKYDASVGVDKLKRDLRKMDNELIAVRGAGIGSGNKSFTEGGSTRPNGKPLWEIAAGLGYNGVSQLSALSTTANSADATTISNSANLIFNYNWGMKWWNQVEVRSQPTGEYGRLSATRYSGPNMMATLRMFRSADDSDFNYGFSIVQNGFIVSNGNGKYTLENAMFAGANLLHVYHISDWSKFETHLTYQMAATPFPQARPSAGAARSSDSGTRMGFDLTLKHQLTPKHGLMFQFSYESMNFSFPSAAVPTNATNQMNSTTSYTAFYKYSWL